MKIAYFSMEFALQPEIPNFAGGLGVLATDLLRSCADLRVPVIGVSMIYHWHDDAEKAFDPAPFMKKIPETVKVNIENREVVVGAWKYEIKGAKSSVPLYCLTTNFPENKRWDRDLSKELYPSHEYTRLAQEAILGIGGLRLLRRLGYHDISIFHMNEGHAAFLTLERLKETGYDDSEVRKTCRFTTHTPVAAGHDHFNHKLARQVLGPLIPWHIKELAGEKHLNMTRLALNLSKAANGVSKKHREVCEKMFPGHHFLSVTNGVYHKTWVSGPMAKCFDKSLKGWQKDPYKLCEAEKIPDEALMKAHRENKKKLIGFINGNETYFPYPKASLEENDFFDEDTLTVTFSRRFVPYKRPLLLFHDLDRLREVGYKKLQIIYAGRCHPGDTFCNKVMAELRKYEKELRGQVRLAVMPDRNLDTCALLAAGSDVWLNNPEPPLEASGTSGMKAAMNGGINLSVADGWWIEAIEHHPESGWTFGTDVSGHDEIDAEELYKSLEEMIKMYTKKPAEWTKRMKAAICLGGYFNTHRCAQEYLDLLWSDS